MVWAPCFTNTISSLFPSVWEAYVVATHEADSFMEKTANE